MYLQVKIYSIGFRGHRSSEVIECTARDEDWAPHQEVSTSSNTQHTGHNWASRSRQTNSYLAPLAKLRRRPSRWNAVHLQNQLLDIPHTSGFQLCTYTTNTALCNSNNVVHCDTCSQCGNQYVGMRIHTLKQLIVNIHKNCEGKLSTTSFILIWHQIAPINSHCFSIHPW